MLAIGTATAIAGAVAKNKSAKDAEEKAKSAKQEYGAQLKAAEARRQDITDPFKDIKDLSGMIRNPYAGLQVATQAAEFQAEEADLSLASSLDTLRATGASAGGATALAQAALRSKKGISANIEQQEAQNTRLRAQGETQMQGMLMQEKARVQGARAQGEQFMFGAREQREGIELDRLAGLMGNQQQQENAYSMARMNVWGSALGQIGGAAMAAGGQNLAAGKTTFGSNTPGGNPFSTGTNTLNWGQYQNLPTQIKIPMSSCFTKGSLIKMFDGTLKAIENIKIGEWVRTGANKKGVVKQTLIHAINNKINIYRHNETGVTGSHWVFLAGEWMPARRLRWIFNWDKKQELVDNVYNLEIKGDNETYITNNIIVSGKLYK
jgi:hypothetical protein